MLFQEFARFHLKKKILERNQPKPSINDKDLKAVLKNDPKNHNQKFTTKMNKLKLSGEKKID